MEEGNAGRDRKTIFGTYLRLQFKPCQEPEQSLATSTISADEAHFCLGQCGLDFLSFFTLKRKTSKREHECTPNIERMLSKRVDSLNILVCLQGMEPESVGRCGRWSDFRSVLSNNFLTLGALPNKSS